MTRLARMHWSAECIQLDQDSMQASVQVSCGIIVTRGSVRSRAQYSSDKDLPAVS